jgi:hypothetical protein
LSVTFYAETFKEDFMCGIKIGWIIPVIVLMVLITVIGIGIYQINSDGNPWFFGEEPVYQWEFLR